MMCSTNHLIVSLGLKQSASAQGLADEVRDCLPSAIEVRVNTREVRITIRGRFAGWALVTSSPTIKATVTASPPVTRYSRSFDELIEKAVIARGPSARDGGPHLFRQREIDFTDSIPAACFLRTSDSILSSAVSIGPSFSEEPPWRVSRVADWVSFPTADDTGARRRG